MKPIFQVPKGRAPDSGADKSRISLCLVRANANVHSVLDGCGPHRKVRELARSLGYVDAVRLLGGDDHSLLGRIDSLLGGVLLAAAPVTPGIVALLDAKTEFVRLCHDLIDRFRERRSGLGRYDRTQRLAAAHTVLVVVAYFDALDEADFPIPLADIEFTRFEQMSIAGQGSPANYDSFLGQIDAAGECLPSVHGAHEEYRHDLTLYYERLSSYLERFLGGLAAWDRLTASQHGRFLEVIREVPAVAVRRYGEHLRALAVDFPEVKLWLDQLEHEATRNTVHLLEPSLTRLARELESLSSSRVPAEQARSIARAHQAALTRPITLSGDVPPNLTVPTLQQAYIPPLFRVTDVDPQGGPSNEAWWERLDINDDLEGFLVRCLTSIYMTEAPILVLGQPGAGKSVLTRVLAARLPPSDFLAAHVPLRDVAAEFEIQRQIEEAILQATGEQMAWPALVRSNPDALPVVLVDGFDELLQATGVRQTDYLLRLADFQRREADQGRPVAIIVTTRTSVADRAQTPTGTLLVRLEPFDAARIRAWITVWNDVNVINFQRTGTGPLDIEVVMIRAEIACQPLLLLMLALYDADGNALRRFAADLRSTELYEQLLVSFARREVAKHRPDIVGEDLAAAVEVEMRRLSIVAFAMFNRASQWITEAELERDLTAIFGPSQQITAGLRAPVRSAELALGRFFFVHRSRARRDGSALHTFEFLHATFGEYLVARLTWQVILDTQTRDRATVLPAGGIDDEFMHALLSFAALAGRRPIVDFLCTMSASLQTGPRQDLAELLIRLFRLAGLPRSGRAFETYQPRRLTVSRRHAAYSANLVLLIVIVRGSIAVSQIYSQDGDVIDAWRDDSMLWQSQLGLDFHGQMQALAVERFWAATQRDLRLTMDDGTTEPGSVDPLWMYDIRRDRWGAFSWSYSSRLALQRRVNFLCRGHLDQMFHTVEPLLNALGPYTLSRFYSIFPDQPGTSVSAGRVAAEAGVLPIGDGSVADRESAYLRCAMICIQGDPWIKDGAEPYSLTALLLNALSVDPHIPGDAAARILETIIHGYQWPLAPVAPRLATCTLALLMRDGFASEDHGRLAIAIGQLDSNDVPTAVRRQLLARLEELNLPVKPWP